MDTRSAAPVPARTAALSLAALGVVFGDIGTSPLYAVRESLVHIPLTTANIFGVLSLIFWSLILVISVKYVIFILRADNNGEGGTIALLSLIKPKQFGKRKYSILFLMGLLGTSLLFCDGMITPAISVVSAVEGLSLVSPYFNDLVVPFSFILLLVFFTLQSKGTERIGTFFGPIMGLWFICLGIIGLRGIMRHSVILYAVNPIYAIHLFHTNRFLSLFVLTGVFLVMTGGEALYADISHFGKKPIRLCWFILVLPALLLNYFGQGAHLIFHPEHIDNPFYFAAPKWILYPMIGLATAAAIIASQAMISAVFSLAKQAIALQFLPRMNVVYSSHQIKGQVYVPAINMTLAIGTLVLLITFKHSSNLANAYGLAVNLAMVIVTLLVTVVMYSHWKWSWLKILLFASIFLTIDMAFLLSNSLKVLNKGWFTLVFAFLGLMLMITWHRGLKMLSKATSRRKITIKEIAKKALASNANKVPGVAVFINEPYNESKSSLYRQLDTTYTINEITILLDVAISEKPIINIHERVEKLRQSFGIYHLRFHYGFMQAIDIPNTLRVLRDLHILPFLADQYKYTYYLEIVNTQVGMRYNPQVPLWQKRLFTGMLNNFTQNMNYYHLPVNQTMLIGTYYEI